LKKNSWSHVIAYNLVRSVMQQAALRHQVDLERLSFQGTLDALNHFAEAIHAAHGKPHRQAELLDAMFEAIAQDQLPFGPVAPSLEPKNAVPKLTRSSPNPVAKCGLLPEVVAQRNPYFSAIPV
jgi:hypothetical protein